MNHSRGGLQPERIATREDPRAAGGDLLLDTSGPPPVNRRRCTRGSVPVRTGQHPRGGAKAGRPPWSGGHSCRDVRAATHFLVSQAPRCHSAVRLWLAHEPCACREPIKKKLGSEDFFLGGCWWVTGVTSLASDHPSVHSSDPPDHPRTCMHL
jgi:hypothetical protein